MPAVPPLVDRIAHALTRAGVRPEHALGVGCSGGPDSMALAHAMAELGRRGRVGSVMLLHVNHGLRPEAAAEAALVEDAGRVLGLPVALARVTVDRARASLERAAREARYQAFERLADEHGLARILLAHTASDQAETVLMRIIRGTGITGLGGIPRQRGRYLRPLMDTTRPEIEAYVAAHGVPCARDPMNQDRAYFRVRVRGQWLPALRAENPGLDEALCRLADAARSQGEVMDFAARMLLERAQTAELSAAAAELLSGLEHGPRPGLDIRILRQAPGAVMRRALALEAAKATGEPIATPAGTSLVTSDEHVSARHLEALAELIARPAAGTVTLDLPGLTAVRSYDTLRLVPRQTAEPAASEPTGPAIEVHGPAPPYIVRPWQPGDRMRPARLKGRSRKLSDLYTDAKIPRSQRAGAVVVVRAVDGEIEWAEHIGPAYGSHVRVVLTPFAPVASNKVSN